MTKLSKGNRNSESSKAIGNYLESVYWSEQNSKEGEVVKLKIFREGQLLSIQGKIQQQRLYYNSENRQTLGSNGPIRISKDGFSSAWSIWYEMFVSHVSRYLNDTRWVQTVIDNRKILGEHEEWKDRIDYLVKNQPYCLSTGSS